jgi:hypothetical protein
MKFVSHADLQKNQLQNAILHPLGSAPGTPATGQMYFDTALGAPRWYDGSAFTNKATDSLLLGGSSLANVLSRSNHTGTQLASTISNFTSAVQAVSVSTLAAATTTLDMGSQKIINQADPTNPQDSATKNYVDVTLQSAVAGIDGKASVRAASTANITLTAPGTTMDGVTMANGDRFLAKNQTTASQNGVYIFNGSAATATRALDADNNNEITPGAFWFVEEGTTNATTQWRVANTGAITVGTTSITITQWGAGSSYTNGNGLSLAGSVFSVLADPVSGGGISVTASGVKVDTAVVARKFSVDIGNGSLTTITVTHNLGTKDVITTVRQNSDDAVVLADVINATTNTVTVTFSVAPTTNQYRVTCIG